MGKSCENNGEDGSFPKRHRQACLLCRRTPVAHTSILCSYDKYRLAVGEIHFHYLLFAQQLFFPLIKLAAHFQWWKQSRKLGHREVKHRGFARGADGVARDLCWDKVHSHQIMIDLHGTWWKYLCNGFCFLFLERKNTHTRAHMPTHFLPIWAFSWWQLVPPSNQRANSSPSLPHCLIYTPAHRRLSGHIMKAKEMDKQIKRMTPEIWWPDFPSAHHSVSWAWCWCDNRFGFTTPQHI